MQIGIGSGHKQSVVLAYDDGRPLTADGGAVVVETGPSLNLHCLVQDVEADTIKKMAKALKTNLRHLLRSIPRKLRPAGFTGADRLVLSLPGISTEHDWEIGRECVEACGVWPAAAPANFCIVDDTYAGLIAGARSTRGLCAISGTGASVYVGTPDGSHRPFRPDKSHKFDGYGAMLGDHGSGFRLAIRTLEQICRDYDRLGHFDPAEDKLGMYALVRAVAAQMNSPARETEPYSLSRFQNWFDQQMANRDANWRFRIAELARVVTREANAGNGYARNRVDEAAQGMALTLRLALQRPEYINMDGAKVYCHGGMFRNCRYYFDQVQTHLGEDAGNGLALAEYRPCVGALLIAVSSNWSVPDSESIRAIEAVLETVPEAKRPLVANQPDPKAGPYRGAP